MRSILTLFLVFLGWLGSGFVLAQTTFERWTLESKETITEAYTTSESNTTFGIFCSANQCMFYLHQPTACLPNQRYPALVRNQIQAQAITMKCTIVGNKLFLIIEPFNQILQATQLGEQISFVVSLQSPEFITTRFSLSGARQAVTQALQISSQKAVPKVAPPVQPAPPKIPQPVRPNSKDSVT
jgi:hypothetical protein